MADNLKENIENAGRAVKNAAKNAAKTAGENVKGQAIKEKCGC